MDASQQAEREKIRAMKLAALRAEIQKGVDSGLDIPAEEVFERLRIKIERMVQERSARDIQID